jgi:hypothetical protein
LAGIILIMVHPRKNDSRRINRNRRGNYRAPPKKPDSFVVQVVGLSLFAGAITWVLAPQLERTWSQMSLSPDERADIERSVYYQNCDAARAAGAAPIYRGQPGYREGMDGDLDGVACEPYYGR